MLSGRCETAGVLRLGTTVLGVDDFERALDFWTHALDYVPRDPVLPGADYVVLVPRSGAGAHLALDTSETPVQEHPRVHLDLYADGPAAQAAEVERLVALGAARVDWDLYPPDPDFIVLADTEGNRFCVVDTTKDPLS
jgi:catechol 2,3-dioxygenase-like lactoylglutathione lyase family enzyme